MSAIFQQIERFNENANEHRWFTYMQERAPKPRKKPYADLDTLNKLVTDITYAISQETIKTDKKNPWLYTYYSFNSEQVFFYKRQNPF